MTTVPSLRRTLSLSNLQAQKQEGVQGSNNTSRLFQAIVALQPETASKSNVKKLTVKTDKKPNYETTALNITRSGHLLGGDEIIDLMRALGLPTFSVNELRGIDDAPDPVAYTQNLIENFTSKKKQYDEGRLDENNDEIYIKIFNNQTICELISSRLNNEETLTQTDLDNLASQLLENNAFKQFIETHLTAVTENKRRANQAIKEKILNRIQVNGGAIKPFVIVSEKTIGTSSPEEAISKALRLEFEFMNSYGKSSIPRTFFIISNNSHHWLASRCAIALTSDDQMKISITTIDSLGQTHKTISFEDKQEFFLEIALPDSYQWAPSEYIETAQQTQDEYVLSTCGIRAAFNVRLMSNLLDQPVEADQLWKIAPNENVLREIAKQILRDPSKNLKDLIDKHSDGQEITFSIPILGDSDDSSFYKEKDLTILRVMLAALEEYEKGEGLTAPNVLKRVTSLCGGEFGITYKDDNPKCIRNRYGRIREIEPKGFINFVLLHRAFIILEAKIPAPLTIDTDLKRLKAKIIYILEKETNIEAPLSSEGNTEDLEEIYAFVKDNYYDVSIPRIRNELDSLLGLTIQNQEDLYFFGRKIIIIGELCHEIEKDLKPIQDNEANSVKLKEILETFNAINKERNHFVHAGALVKQFLELDQDQKLRRKLYGVIIKALKLIHSPDIKEILKTAISTRDLRDLSERRINQKRKVKKEKTVTLIEKRLRKSQEYTRLLEACRINENGSLSAREQHAIKLGETPEVDKLINIGNKLNIFIPVNALKMLRVKMDHESKMEEDAGYRKCFEAAVESDSFDLASLEDCERVLRKIATLSTQSEWKLRDEFSNQSQMPLFLSKLKCFLEIYNNSQMSSLDEMHKTLSQSADLNGSNWVLRKGVKGGDSFNKLKSFHTNLTKTAKAHEQDLKKQAYSKAVSMATEAIPGFNIQRKEDVAAALNTIAIYLQKEQWKAKEKNHEALVQVLASSCSTHVIKDPRTLESRIKEELRDEKARLVQKIDREINFAYEVSRHSTSSQRTSAIKEYIVTVVGQYMRELTEISALEQTLLSQTALEAGVTMRTLRSKGLAHEILRFDPDHFERTFREIILPAKSDFNAIKCIHSHNSEKKLSIKIRVNLAGAYLRLNLLQEASKQLCYVIDCIEKDNDLFKKDLEHEEDLLRIAEENFPLTIDIGLITSTALLVSVYNMLPDYKTSLEALSKISKRLKTLTVRNLPKLNNAIALLRMRYGECLCNTGTKDLNEAAVQYDLAFETAYDPQLKIKILIGKVDRISKLMIDSTPIDNDLLTKVENDLIQLSKIKNLTALDRYKLLEIELQIELLKKQTTGFNLTYKKLKNFLNDEKISLKNELGDAADFLFFDTIRIKLSTVKALDNLEELNNAYEEFKQEFEKIKKQDLRKNTNAALCGRELSDFICLFIKKHASIDLKTISEMLNKSQFCLDCARIGLSEEFVKKSANFLVQTYFNLRQRENSFIEIALEIGRNYNLELTQIEKIVTAEKHYQEAQKSNAKEAIFHFTQAINSLKSLDPISEGNRIMITSIKAARLSAINSLIFDIIWTQYNLKSPPPTKGKLLVKFPPGILSLKKINRFLSDELKLNSKAQLAKDSITAYIPISKILAKYKLLIGDLNF